VVGIPVSAVSRRRKRLGPSDYLGLVKGFLKVIGIALLGVAALGSGVTGIVWIGNPPGDRGSEAFFANALERSEGEVVRLGDFSDFSWDRVCKTGGYGGTRETEALIGADWNYWWWPILQESYGLVIFLDQDEVVASFLDKQYLASVWECYERSEAFFLLTRSPSGRHWLEPMARNGQ
jgi:hypothetical protein